MFKEHVTEKDPDVQTVTRLIMTKDANLVIIFIYLVSLMSVFFQAKKKKQPMLHFVHRNVITCSLGKIIQTKKTKKQTN